MTKIYDLVAQGKMLEAITAHRQTFNSSMADAKATVENLRGQVK